MRLSLSGLGRSLRLVDARQSHFQPYQLQIRQRQGRREGERRGDRIVTTIWSYIALDRTPNMDCYWRGGSTQFMVCLAGNSQVPHVCEDEAEPKAKAAQFELGT